MKSPLCEYGMVVDDGTAKLPIGTIRHSYGQLREQKTTFCGNGWNLLNPNRLPQLQRQRYED
jgi:hypothetical protein